MPTLVHNLSTTTLAPQP